MPPAPPPALPRGWLSREALDAIAAFSATEEARAEGKGELLPAAVAAARRDLAQLQLFLRSHAREEVGPGGEGGFGLAPGGGAAPQAAPPLAVRVRPGLPAEVKGPGGCLSPTLVAPVLCPNAACGTVLAVDVPAEHGEDRGLHLSCGTCGTGLCGHCGAQWVVPGSFTAASHVDALCSEHARALTRAAAAHVVEAELHAPDGAAKKCPNPTCTRLHTRYFGHACHTVSCPCGLRNFCFCCLASSEEECHSRGCPRTCNDACGCVPCVECGTSALKGGRCGDCNGDYAGDGCITCRLGRPEKAEEAAARLARHERAVAALKRRSPTWAGPRRFRTDAPRGLPGAAEEQAGGLALRRAAGAGARASPWLTACMGVELTGPAAAAREGLQLMDACFNEMGLLVGRAVPLELREYLVRSEATGATALLLGGALEPALPPGQVEAAPAVSDLPPGTLNQAGAMVTPDSLRALPPGSRYSWGPWVFEQRERMSHFWTHELVGQPGFLAVEFWHSTSGWFRIKRGHAPSVVIWGDGSSGGHQSFETPEFWNLPGVAYAVPTSCLFEALGAVINPSWTRGVKGDGFSVQLRPDRLVPFFGIEPSFQTLANLEARTPLFVPAAFKPGDRVRLAPLARPSLCGSATALLGAGGAGEVLTAEGLDFLFSAAPSRDIVVATEEALRLLGRASEGEGGGGGGGGGGAGALPPAADALCQLADAQPSRETAAATAQGEAGVAPIEPPEDLTYGTAPGVARSLSHGAREPLPPSLARSTLGPYLRVARAALASALPAHLGYATALLRHFAALLRPATVTPFEAPPGAVEAPGAPAHPGEYRDVEARPPVRVAWSPHGRPPGGEEISIYCGEGESPEEGMPCAHGGGMLWRNHWSCCGERNWNGVPCGGPRLPPTTPPRAAAEVAATRRASRRAGWVLELLSLEGVETLAAALGCGSEPARAAAAAVVAALGAEERDAGAAAGWALMWEREIVALGGAVPGGGVACRVCGQHFDSKERLLRTHLVAGSRCPSASQSLGGGGPAAAVAALRAAREAPDARAVSSRALAALRALRDAGPVGAQLALLWVGTIAPLGDIAAADPSGGWVEAALGSDNVALLEATAGAPAPPAPLPGSADAAAAFGAPAPPLEWARLAALSYEAGARAVAARARPPPVPSAEAVRTAQAARFNTEEEALAAAIAASLQAPPPPPPLPPPPLPALPQTALSAAAAAAAAALPPLLLRALARVRDAATLGGLRAPAPAKRQRCRYFFTASGCRSGAKCKYSHEA